MAYRLVFSLASPFLRAASTVAKEREEQRIGLFQVKLIRLEIRLEKSYFTEMFPIHFYVISLL